jgi:hypothetical protein
MQSLDYKRLALIGAVIAGSTVTWAVTRDWLSQPDRFSGIVTMLWPALAAIVMGAVVALAFALMEHAWDRLAGILVSWTTFIFFWPADIWYISALPLFVGFWWLAGRDIRHDMADRRTIRMQTTLTRGMKLILLGSFVMVSLGFYLLPSSQEITVGNVSEGVQQSVQGAYDNPLIEQQLSQLPAGAQAQFRRDVGRYIDDTVRAWLSPVRQFIPPILAFGLFLVLWSLNVILRVPAVWLGRGLFEVLKRTGFVRITEGSIQAEVLTL